MKSIFYPSLLVFSKRGRDRLRKPKVLELVLSVIVVLTLPHQDLQAAETTIEDQISCESIGGYWNPAGYPENSCILGQVFPGADDIWTIQTDVYLRIAGTLYQSIEGTINNYGTLDISSSFDDVTLYGTIKNYGTFDPGSLSVTIGGSVYNSGLIDIDDGYITSHPGSIFKNDGTFVIAAYYAILFGGLENTGTLRNEGFIELTSDDIIENKAGGVIENIASDDGYPSNGLIDGTGVINNACGGIIKNDGTIEVIVNQEVNCEEAVSGLSNAVDDLFLGPGIEKALTGILGEVEKTLNRGSNTKGAINQLEAFIAQVKALIGKKLTQEEGSARTPDRRNGPRILDTGLSEIFSPIMPRLARCCHRSIRRPVFADRAPSGGADCCRT